MKREYFLKRTGQAGVTMFAVITITFGMIRLLPGDPQTFLMAMAGGQGVGGDFDEEVVAQRVDYDPGDSILEQYVSFLTSLAQGDLGASAVYDPGTPVVEILMTGLPWTIFLVALALPLTFAIGIVLGALMAYKEGSWFDLVASSLSTLLNSIPYYIAAVVMVYFLGYQWGIFPYGGRSPSGVDPGFTVAFVGGIFYHAALPVASIVLTAFGFRALAMRGNSIQVLGEDYVRVAKLRGLAERRVALQYVGRNAVLPIYTEFMIAIGVVLGSTVILEEIFNYQGLGWYFFYAIAYRDYPLMMGAFLVITITVVLGLYVADLTYGLIDPRASTDTQAGGQNVSLSQSLAGLARAVLAIPFRINRGVRRRLRRRRDSGRSPAVGDEPTASGSESLFETTADVQLSRSERYRRLVDEYVLAPGRIVWNDNRARIGGAIIAFYVILGTVGVWLVEEPHQDQGPMLVGAFETLEHPFGTTVTGQDLLSLIVHSTPGMLELMFAGAVVATIVATVVGLVSGYAGGYVDRFLMLCADTILSIPGLPLLMVLAVIFEPSRPWAVGLLLTINLWGGTARQIRSQVLAVREENYIEASDIMSLPRTTILLKDVLPNVAPFVFIRAVDMARQVIVLSVALYFLGVLPMTRNNWGVILQDAYQNLGLHSAAAVHWIMVPVVAIVLLIYGLILFAQGTDRVFNPRVRTKHASTYDDEGGDRTVATAPGDD